MTKLISPLNELIESVHDYGINVGAREIFIDVLNEDEGLDYKSASRFIKNMQILSRRGDEGILIHCITDGGSWNYGMAIYDTIKNSKSYVTTLSYALASSMSSIIIQAADARVLMPNCEFMVHHPSMEYAGNPPDFVSNTNRFKKDMDMLITIYSEKCVGGSYFKQKSWDIARIKKFFKDKMDKTNEWYIDVEEAVDMGLADGILGDKKYPSISTISGV